MRHFSWTLALVSCSLAALALPPAPAAAQDRDRNSDEPFKWSGEIQRDRWVYVHNLNGPVRVEAGTGSKVEITATKRWRRGNPADVKISVQQVGGGKGDVFACAFWNDDASCDEDGLHSHRDGWRSHDRENDVSVEFVVRLPAGVKVNATTVNGQVVVDGASAAVSASSVNGNVEARSSGGPVLVKTVNGSINVRAGTIGDDRLEYRTTNGSITVELPASANADIDMRTVNGSLSSDFPLTIQGRIDRRHMQATLGRGGPTLRLATVNGSIHLRKA